MQTRSIALTVALACAACQSSDPQTGGETHWQKTFLAGCISDAQCAAPLTCIQHLCTRPCTDDDACDVAQGDVCDESGICVVQEREGCTSGDPCDADHEGWLCDETALDACRSEVTVCRDGAWLDGVLDVCRTQMSEAEPDGPDGPETLTVRRADAIQPVDVLFVVDQSTSMFEASVAAGQAIPSFVAGLARAASATSAWR
ncbi:MAG: hypothetical protein U1F43_27495 [Myxococcota bacterium]